MKHFFYLILIVALSSCTESPRLTSIVTGDAESYIDMEALSVTRSTLASSITFWEEKLSDEPNNPVYLEKLAGLYANRFRSSGSIDDLKKSTSILTVLADKESVTVLQQLARNAISRHEFGDAEQYVHRALAQGEDRYGSTLMLIDVLLEKGDVVTARNMLEDLDSPQRFDEQIRWVKVLDAEGDLDKAVQVMEAALINAYAMNNDALISWSLSNLADMYGHQGLIRKSYNTHLAALKENPGEIHSIKAIGWIAYSHDMNTELAQSIWSALYEIDQHPATELLLAESYELKGDNEMSDQLARSAVRKVSSPSYGNMYSSVLGDLYLESAPQQAQEFAEYDLEQRAHPVSYSLLAASLSANGRSDEAVTVIKEKVLGKTYEPEALFKSGRVLAEAGEIALAKDLLEEALDASFELGPLASQEIKVLLTRL